MRALRLLQSGRRPPNSIVTSWEPRHDWRAAWRTLGLFHAEFFAFAIKHEPLAGDEPNLQHRPRAFVLGLRDAVNEGIAFEYCRPYGREIISLAYQLGTQLRQVVCSLFCHQTMPVQPFTLSIDLNQSVGRNEDGLRRNRRRVDLDAEGRMHGMNNNTDTVSGYRTIYSVDGQYRRKAFGRLGLRGGSKTSRSSIKQGSDSHARHKRRQRSWPGDRTNQNTLGPTDGRMHPSTGIAYTDKSLCNG